MSIVIRSFLTNSFRNLSKNDEKMAFQADITIKSLTFISPTRSTEMGGKS
jgi:hypothetical protein